MYKQNKLLNATRGCPLIDGAYFPARYLTTTVSTAVIGTTSRMLHAFQLRTHSGLDGKMVHIYFESDILQLTVQQQPLKLVDAER
jgi:hypothetical protein